MSETLELAKALIARSSVTPEDGGCQDMIATRLRGLGFSIERMDEGGVRNLWARRLRPCARWKSRGPAGVSRSCPGSRHLPVSRKSGR